MSTAISSDRETAVNELDVSLSETGGSDVFTVQSAVNVINSVKKLENQIRNWVNPSAFPVDGRINEEVLQKYVNATNQPSHNGSVQLWTYWTELLIS